MAELLEAYIQDNPDFISAEEPTAKVRAQVREQAAAHVLRDAPNNLLRKKRPFEPEEYHAYRDENRRRLTSDAVWQFEKMLIKAVRQTTVDLNAIPKVLQTHLEGTRYKYMNSEVDLTQWKHKVLIPYSLLDPNAITVELPINQNDKFTPIIEVFSEGGVDSQTQELEVKTKIFAYDRWRIHKDTYENVDVEILILKIPEAFPFEIRTASGTKIKLLDYYFLADEEDWYIYLPDEVDDDGKVIYAYEKWYSHKIGSLPFNAVPGINAQTDDDHYYQESFCKSYFEWADEFQSRMEDDQVVHTRYAYPREVVDGTQCTTCSGSGEVNKTGFNGKGQKTLMKTTCHTCKGTGYVGASSISGRTIRPTNLVSKDNKEPVAFITPPTDILNHTTMNAMLFLEEGRKSLGLDSLMPAQEAEETKKLREENKVELLLNYCFEVTRWKQTHLNQRLRLVDVALKEDSITIQKPLAVAVRGAEALKEEINNSLPIDRYFTVKKYIQEKYNDDVVKQRVHLMAIQFAPFIILTQEEKEFRLGRGYDEVDLLKADHAIMIFENIKDAMDNPEMFLTADSDTLLELAATEFDRLINVSTMS